MATMKASPSRTRPNRPAYPPPVEGAAASGMNNVFEGLDGVAWSTFMRALDEIFEVPHPLLLACSAKTCCGELEKEMRAPFAGTVNTERKAAQRGGGAVVGSHGMQVDFNVYGEVLKHSHISCQSETHLLAWLQAALSTGVWKQKPDTNSRPGFGVSCPRF